MKLFQALFDVVTAPIEVIKDIVTLGGVAVDEDKSYTRRRAEKIDQDLSS